jgi:hypothetical protein
VRFRILLLVAAIAALAAAGHPICAQQKVDEPLVPRAKHPWGKFPAGAWKRMRLTKETFDERGVPTATVYVIKTTVKAVDDRGYTLLTEQAAEIAGQSLPEGQQETRQGFSGEVGGQKAEPAEKLGESEVTLNGRRIPCQVRKVVMNGDGNGKTTATAFYSADVAPHLLRRELSVEIGPAGETASFVHTVKKHPKQSKESMEVWCDDVPGGVVAQWSKELDTEGKLISRSTLELLSYDSGKAAAAPQVIRPRRFDRKRARRDEKMSAAQRFER